MTSLVISNEKVDHKTSFAQLLEESFDITAVTANWIKDDNTHASICLKGYAERTDKTQINFRASRHSIIHKDVAGACDNLNSSHVLSAWMWCKVRDVHLQVVFISLNLKEGKQQGI